MPRETVELKIDTGTTSTITGSGCILSVFAYIGGFIIGLLILATLF